jgi:hypothetical protein
MLMSKGKPAQPRWAAGRMLDERSDGPNFGRPPSSYGGPSTPTMLASPSSGPAGIPHTTTDLCVIRPLWPLTDPIPGLWRKPSQITGLGFGSDNSAVIRNIIKRDNPDNKPG